MNMATMTDTKSRLVSAVVRVLSAARLSEASGLEIAAEFVSFLIGPDKLRYNSNCGSCIKVADSANATLEPLDEWIARRFEVLCSCIILGLIKPRSEEHTSE